MFAAVTNCGPCTDTCVKNGSVTNPVNLICFKFKRISKTSSRTPGIVANSLFIPFIRTAVIAVPSNSVNKTRRNVLPIVNP